MFISKKKYKSLLKRIADLEGQVQSQQVDTVTKIDCNGVLLRTCRINDKSL